MVPTGTIGTVLQEQHLTAGTKATFSPVPQPVYWFGDLSPLTS